MSKRFVLGELSLDGSLRSARGVLPYAMLAKEKGFTELYVPEHNAREASLINGITTYPVANLKDFVLHLSEDHKIQPQSWLDYQELEITEEFASDLKEVKGQEQAKRALEIGAAGGHNLFFKGPPGGGKTLLARTLPSILPKLTLQESLEVTKIYSTAGMLPKEVPLIIRRPFRSPHHSISYAGLIGGGSNPRPGEISLSHRGVLFLDEFPEFPRQVLESMRQPMEDGMVAVSRVKSTCYFPSRFMLVAAANPCPCGYLGDSKHACTCSSPQITRYQKRVSGPILDRIDLQVEVPAVKFEKLTDEGDAPEDSAVVRSRVESAHERQKRRFSEDGIYANSEMRLREIKKHCRIEKDAYQLLKEAVAKMNLSARSYFKIIKLAQTIADLEGVEKIKSHHCAEALQYRFREAGMTV